MTPLSEAQRRFGSAPIIRAKKLKKLTPEQLVTGMTAEQLREQQQRLKREFLERRKAA